MDIGSRIALLVNLGKRLKVVLNPDESCSDLESKLRHLISNLESRNRWFTSNNVYSAIEGVVQFLEEDELLKWTGMYLDRIKAKKTSVKVGLVMAGNIPLVGFHDFVSVFIVGDHALIKLSSDDSDLLPLVFEIAEEIDPEFKKCYTLVEGALKGMDKVIATGGNNTSRYFHYYFDHYPNIIRKSRTSVAVIDQSTTAADISELAGDIFSYFGMGCRSVSKLLIHESVDLQWLMDELTQYDTVSENQKYLNNLTFQKSVFLIDKIPFLDGGFFLLKEDERVFSPISVIHYERYANESELDQFIDRNREDIQCVIGKSNPKFISFGEGQKPHLWDYPDQVDTVEFLLAD